MPAPNTFDYWLLLLISGPGFIFNLSVILFICLKKKRCYSALMLVPFLGMQLTMFMQTWQGKPCVWCLALSVILSIGTLIAASWWIWRQRRDQTWQEVASDQKMFVVTAIIVAGLILLSTVPGFLNAINS